MFRLRAGGFSGVACRGGPIRLQIEAYLLTSCLLPVFRQSLRRWQISSVPMKRQEMEMEKEQREKRRAPPFTTGASFLFQRGQERFRGQTLC